MPRPARQPLGLHLAQVSESRQPGLRRRPGRGGRIAAGLAGADLAEEPGSSASQRELADAVGVQGATLTHHLNAMESRRGWSPGRRDPANRRLHLVELTPAGDALFLRLRDAADGLRPATAHRPVARQTESARDLAGQAQGQRRLKPLGGAAADQLGRLRITADGAARRRSRPSSSRTISLLIRCQRLPDRGQRRAWPATAAEESSNPPTATSSGTRRPALRQRRHGARAPSRRRRRTRRPGRARGRAGAAIAALPESSRVVARLDQRRGSNDLAEHVAVSGSGRC